MVISNKLSITLVGVSCFVGIGLFFIKYLTITLEDDIKKTKVEIAKAVEDNKILSAEWQALISPERLQRLAEKHLRQPLEYVVISDQPIDTLIENKVHSSTQEDRKRQKSELSELINGLMN